MDAYSHMTKLCLQSAKFISMKSKFLQIREIYSPRNICAVQYPPTMLISDGKKASRSKAATTNFTSAIFPSFKDSQAGL